jgi:hypothetical protein
MGGLLVVLAREATHQEPAFGNGQHTRCDYIRADDGVEMECFAHVLFILLVRFDGVICALIAWTSMAV